jgi:hypothetical protein
MNNLTEYFKNIHQCQCGSGLISFFYKNEKQQDEKACDKCKHKLLFKIFDEHFLDIFEKWLPEIMFAERGKAPIGYEYQWQDLLQEKNCIRSKEIKNIQDHILIKCPEDKEFNIYVPNNLAEKVLTNGKL